MNGDIYGAPAVEEKLENQGARVRVNENADFNEWATAG